MKTHRFRNLQVWQRAIGFVVFIYKLTDNFPENERYGLVDQLKRAAVSICLNIAEGSGAGSDPEFSRFLRMAQRSAYEVMAALEIAIKLKIIKKEDAEQALDEVDQLSAMLSGLIKHVNSGV